MKKILYIFCVFCVNIAFYTSAVNSDGNTNYSVHNNVLVNSNTSKDDFINLVINRINNAETALIELVIDKSTNNYVKEWNEGNASKHINKTDSPLKEFLPSLEKHISSGYQNIFALKKSLKKSFNKVPESILVQIWRTLMMRSVQNNIKNIMGQDFDKLQKVCKLYVDSTQEYKDYINRIIGFIHKWSSVNANTVDASIVRLFSKADSIVQSSRGSVFLLNQDGSINLSFALNFADVILGFLNLAQTYVLQLDTSKASNTLKKSSNANNQSSPSLLVKRSTTKDLQNRIAQEVLQKSNKLYRSSKVNDMNQGNIISQEDLSITQQEIDTEANRLVASIHNIYNTMLFSINIYDSIEKVNESAKNIQGLVKALFKLQSDYSKYINNLKPGDNLATIKENFKQALVYQKTFAILFAQEHTADTIRYELERITSYIDPIANQLQKNANLSEVQKNALLLIANNLQALKGLINTMDSKNDSSIPLKKLFGPLMRQESRVYEMAASHLITSVVSYILEDFRLSDLNTLQNLRIKTTVHEKALDLIGQQIGRLKIVVPFGKDAQFYQGISRENYNGTSSTSSTWDIISDQQTNILTAIRENINVIKNNRTIEMFIKGSDTAVNIIYPIVKLALPIALSCVGFPAAAATMIAIQSTEEISTKIKNLGPMLHTIDSKFNFFANQLINKHIEDETFGIYGQKP